MAPQNPVTRVEQVAHDLGRLAEQLDEYLGADARRTLLYWRAELLAAMDDLRGAADPPSAAPIGREP
jgi:hypothetical protein